MMSEQKTKKIIKKIKIKKPVMQTAPAKVEADQIKNEFSFIEEELAEIKIDEHIKPSKQNQEVKEEKDTEFDELLNQFISSELRDLDKQISDAEYGVMVCSPKEPTEEKTITTAGLKAGEEVLFRAYTGFINVVNKLALNNNVATITPSITESSLIPNYKPSTGRHIASDTVKGWDIILQFKSSELHGINIASSDDELLDFAEKCTDDELTLCIISYVETIIEIESCEITYLEKSEAIKRKRIERQIYEEHQQRIERNRRFIEAIEKKRFPIDAERLINNYFKTAQKDTEGAYKVLTSNPAVFAPIQVEKIEPKLFGLIKPSPKEGIRVNQRLASFLKKLKA